MAKRPVGRIALMSVRPEFAEAILAGTKTVEFRKRPVAPDVTHVVLYATKPVGAVVGCFEVAGQTTASPDDLWTRFASVAGISREKFFAYYEGSARGTGILVHQVHPTPERPTLLASLGVVRAPQSFQYLDAKFLRKALGVTKRSGRGASGPRAKIQNRSSGKELPVS